MQTIRNNGARVIGWLFVLLALCFLALFLLGAVRPFAPGHGIYPVRGVDVSEYQGEIDWQQIAAQDIQFAFIKATEGSEYVDLTFADNWENAPQAGLAVGAYHFFSFDSPAETQAQNFISAVPAQPGMLPPVVDVELYGQHKGRVPDVQTVRASLETLLSTLQQQYGQAPILYATEQSYRLYLADHFDANPIWIRDIYFRPALPDGRMPTFWQYSATGTLSGYSGAEKNIDLNAFCGSQQEWELFLQDVTIS